jgi:MFS family permease
MRRTTSADSLGGPVETATGRAPAHLVRDISGAVVASTATSLAVFLVGALAVEMSPSLHLSLGSLGASISVYYLAAAGGSVPAGRLAEKLGGTRTMQAAAAAAAVALLLLALLATSFATLVVFMAMAGLVSSCMQPATNRFLIRRIPHSRQGLAFGIKQSSVPFATFLGGLAVPAIGLTVGWRWAFIIAAGVAAMAAAAIPKRRTAPPASSSASAAGERGELLPLGVLAVGFGLGVFATTGLSAFLVVSAVAAGIGKATAGLVAALAGGASMAARVAAGMQADRRGHSHLIIVALMLAVGVLGYVALAVGSATRISAVFVVGAVVAYAAGWGWNGLFNFAVARSHASAPARATGVTQTGGRLAGVLGPLAFGLIVTRSSYAVAWLVAAGFALVGALTVLVGRRVLVAHQGRAPSALRTPVREEPAGV